MMLTRISMERVRIIYSVLLLLFTTLVVYKILSFPLIFGLIIDSGLQYDSGDNESVKIRNGCHHRHLEQPVNITVSASHHMGSLVTSTSLRGLQNTENPSGAGNGTSDTVATKTIPALVSGAAGFIIMYCLYCLTRFVAELYRQKAIRIEGAESDHPEAEKTVKLKDAKRNEDSLTPTVAASHSKGSRSDRQDVHRDRSQFFSHQEESAFVDSGPCQRLHRVPRMLPPLPPEINGEQENIPTLSPYQESLSWMSTLTNSMVEGTMSFGDCSGPRLEGMADLADQHRLLMRSEDITELPAFYRLGYETELASIFPIPFQSNSEARDDKTTHNHDSPEEVVKDTKEEPRDRQPSSCSSLTVDGPSDGDNDSTEEESGLRGESYLKDDATPPKDKAKSSISFRSLERSPDTRPGTGSVGHDISMIGKLLFNDDESDGNVAGLLPFLPPGEGGQWQLWECNQDDPTTPAPTLPFSEEEIDPMPAEEYVRDIFFVPVAKQNRFTQRSEDADAELEEASPLGLRLMDATCAVTHPTVAEVLPISPLIGRIFQGDFILKVNGIDVAGFTTHEVAKLVAGKNFKEDNEAQAMDDEINTGSTAMDKCNQHCYQVIKLTIMSSQRDNVVSDDEDESSVGSGSIDIGVPESSVEL